MTSKKEKKEIPQSLKDIVSKIEEMKVKDLAMLVKILEEKFGVTAPATLTSPSSPEVTSQPAPAEKTEFSVILKKAGPSKIPVIKVIKEITGKGLKETKDFVDAVEKGPQVIKEKLKKEEAEEIKKRLAQVGAEVEIK